MNSETHCGCLARKLRLFYEIGVCKHKGIMNRNAMKINKYHSKLGYAVSENAT